MWGGENIQDTTRKERGWGGRRGGGGEASDVQEGNSYGTGSKSRGYTDQRTGRLPPSHYTAIIETHPADWGSFSGHYVYRNCHCYNRVVPNL